MLHATAILVFARTAKVEQTHKNWGIPGNPQLHKFLLQQTLDAVQASGIPFYLIDESRQKGNTFGERFNNAFRMVFDQGYAHVIAIGSDCPQRTSKDLLYSRQLVEQHIACLGPDSHGGAYLIGLSKQVYETGILNNVNWGTSKVLTQLIGLLCVSNTAYKKLSAYTDINVAGDLLNVLGSRSVHHSLRQLLQKLVFRFRRYIYFPKPCFFPSYCLPQCLFRGPPAPSSCTL